MQKSFFLFTSQVTSCMEYIDLFSGCGGLSLGLHLSGWKGVFAIEKSPDAFKTLKHNLIDKRKHFEWVDWLNKSENDVNTVIKEHKNELYNLRGQIDMVAGGPPCQGFSNAGRRKEDDDRNKLIDSYVEFIRLTQPKIILFENVKGFTQEFKRNKTKGIAYSEYVKKNLKEDGENYIGYEVCGKLVDFSKYGVPQKRTRFILVGFRKDFAERQKLNPEIFFNKLDFYSKNLLKSKGLKITNTVKDAISDLMFKEGTVQSPDSKGFLAGLYGKYSRNLYQKYCRGGKVDLEVAVDSHRFTNHKESTINKFKEIHNRAVKGKSTKKDLNEELGIKKRGMILLDENKPAPTLTTIPDDYLHYSEPRVLTVREYARIQSFPDWYEIKGKYTTGGKLRVKEVPRYSQLGNAVPPLFGELAGLIISKEFMQ